MFDPVDIDKPAGGLEVALNTGEVEQAAKRRPIRPALPLGGKAIEEMIDQPIHHRIIQLDVGIFQQRGQIVGRRTHEGILKIDDPDARSVDHEIA